MLLSLKWLSELVEVPTDIKAFCDKLDLTGTGVEGVRRSGDEYDNIVVGYIAEREQHPDADHLWVCKVDVGEAIVGNDGNPEPLQIVCGAQNFVAGDKVPVALIGAVMPDGTVIKKSKLRGVESRGMNCSGRELGISADHSGLLILPEDAPVGMPIADYLGMSDTVIDLEITPNRPDCLSMRGMAREVGAIYDKDVFEENYDLTCSDEDVNDLVSVTVEDAELCPRYTARLIRGCKIGPSPEWLAERVTAAGSRPINNVVDITNYILFSLGQPLHAFDFAKLAKGEDGKVDITVRSAREGEEFTTLDGEDRILTSDMTVISSGDRAVALAGVMGGLDSEVTDETCDILLESASFSNAHTSRTSRNLGLISESSLRFERGVDDNSCDEFSAQAAALIADICGGTVDTGVVDVYLKHTEPVELSFRVPRFQDFIGAPCPKEDVVAILTRLGCEVEDDGSDVLAVTAPTFRPDLIREVDLYEEVLRIWGMHKVEPTLPGGREKMGGLTLEQRRIELMGDVLRACGLNETVTYSLVPADDLERLQMSEEGRGEAVELINPMSAEQSVMRRSIIPGLLRSVAYNRSRGVANVQLYEEGVVFAAAEGRKKPREKKLIAGVMCGSWNDTAWNEPARQLDFFDGKGVVENLLRELCVKKVRFRVLEGEGASHLQPGRAAEILSGGAVLGWLGEIHPLAAKAFDIDDAVVAFELDVNALLTAANDARDYVDIPRFPAVQMDLAIVVPEDVTAERVLQAIQSAGGKMLSEARLFDVYRDDKNVGAGKKSLAFSLAYRAADRTLSADEVEKTHSRLIKKVCGATGGEVRG